MSFSGQVLPHDDREEPLNNSAEANHGAFPSENIRNEMHCEPGSLHWANRAHNTTDENDSRGTSQQGIQTQNPWQSSHPHQSQSPEDRLLYDDTDESESLGSSTSDEDQDSGRGPPTPCYRCPRSGWTHTAYPVNQDYMCRVTYRYRPKPSLNRRSSRLSSEAMTTRSSEDTLREARDEGNASNHQTKHQAMLDSENAEPAAWREFGELEKVRWIFGLPEPGDRHFNVPDPLRIGLEIGIVHAAFILGREDMTREDVDWWVLELLTWLVLLSGLAVTLTCELLYRWCIK